MKNTIVQFDVFLRTIRQFFYGKKFTEIYPPVLSGSVPLEPTVFPFSTKWKTPSKDRTLFLATSPERALKSALSNGVETCFAIGKSFRTIEDASDTHSPEFFMLEWYRKHAVWSDIMEDIEELVTYCLEGKPMRAFGEKQINFSLPWKRVSLRDLFAKHAGCDLTALLDDKAMKRYVQKKGYNIEGATWEQLFNQIFLNDIEPRLGNDPIFLCDFPARISPLCAPQENNKQYAQRFELYIGGMEIGNGNTESTNRAKIRTVFEHERIARLGKNMEAPAVDEDFLQSLDGMKGTPYAGVGIGVERLAMILFDIPSIQEVHPI